MLVNGQSNWTVKGTFNMSCLYKWTEYFMCACCCFTFRPVNFCFFFLKNTQPMSSFFLKFCHSLDLLVTGLCVVQFSLYSYFWLTNWTPALWSSEFLNCLYNYRWNWTPCSPITIINQTMLCSPFLSYDFELNI